MSTLKMGIATMCDLDDLSRLALFRGLAQPQLQQLSQALHRKTFPAGTTLMTAEQPGEVVYFIRSGTVKVHIEQEDGHDVIIALLGPGESVGEMSALDQMYRSASVVTLEESDLLWLDRHAFRRFLLAMPALSYNLICALSARLRQANEQIQALATLEVEARIARRIVAFAEQYGQPLTNGDQHIPIRLTQSDIANLVGASREHTNKILVSYKERGYLSVDHHHRITIHRLSALASRCR